MCVGRKHLTAERSLVVNGLGPSLPSNKFLTLASARYFPRLWGWDPGRGGVRARMFPQTQGLELATSITSSKLFSGARVVPAQHTSDCP